MKILFQSREIFFVIDLELLSYKLEGLTRGDWNNGSRCSADMEIRMLGPL